MCCSSEHALTLSCAILCQQLVHTECCMVLGLPAHSPLPSGDMPCCGQFDTSHPLYDFLHAVKQEHQSLKPLPNQSAVRMFTSMVVQLVATVTVSQSLCQCRVILMFPVLTSLCLALIISAVFHLLLILHVA